MKRSNSRLIGGILLIVGTSIGGGMLALPVSTASSGFIDSAIFLLLSWLVMTLGALLVLEVNLYLPSGSNMISMAQTTLGKPGKFCTWLCYLLLLYSLLSAYISGSTDVLQELLSLINIAIPSSISSILFTLSLGLVVYNGIKLVDYINRGLMFIKLGTLALLLILIAPHISLKLLSGGELKYISSAIMILITSFSFASIVPSLRSYFKDDVMQLRKAILIGSLIPLFSYIAWDAVLMGVIPAASFENIIQSGHTTTSLTANLSQTTHSIWITDFFRTFATICMLTAFLAVSLGLFDFFADGLKLKKHGKQGLCVFSCTFLPPLILVLFSPDLYLNALQFAGVLCVLLLLVLPILMAYRGRYHLNLKGAYQVGGGKPLLIALVLTAIILLIIAIRGLSINNVPI